MPPRMFVGLQNQCYRCDQILIRRPGSSVYEHMNYSAKKHTPVPAKAWEQINLLEISKPGRAQIYWGSSKQWSQVTIYVVKCGEFHKIGYTNGPVEKRIESMKNGNPYDIEIVLQFTGVKYMEGELHRTFLSKKHRFEWFRLDHEDIEWIRANYIEEEVSIDA